jgi:hypothetical protein
VAVRRIRRRRCAIHEQHGGGGADQRLRSDPRSVQLPDQLVGDAVRITD